DGLLFAPAVGLRAGRGNQPATNLEVGQDIRHCSGRGAIGRGGRQRSVEVLYGAAKSSPNLGGSFPVPKERAELQSSLPDILSGRRSSGGHGRRQSVARGIAISCSALLGEADTMQTFECLSGGDDHG